MKKIIFPLFVFISFSTFAMDSSPCVRNLINTKAVVKMRSLYMDHLFSPQSGKEMTAENLSDLNKIKKEICSTKFNSISESLKKDQQMGKIIVSKKDKIPSQFVDSLIDRDSKKDVTSQEFCQMVDQEISKVDMKNDELWPILQDKIKNLSGDFSSHTGCEELVETIHMTVGKKKREAVLGSLETTSNMPGSEDPRPLQRNKDNFLIIDVEPNKKPSSKNGATAQ